MEDPEGFREAVAEIDAASPETRAAMAQEQTYHDGSKANFDAVLTTTVPSKYKLRATLLSVLTTHPHVHQKALGLTWMQCDPAKWTGLAPGACVDVAEMLSYTEGGGENGS